MFYFRLILFLTCFGVFLYQYAKLTKSYLRYETTTRVRFDDSDSVMPAFFFCLKHPFSPLQMFHYLGLGKHLKESLIDYDYYLSELGNLTKTQLYDYLFNSFLTKANQGLVKEMLLDNTYLKEFSFIMCFFRVKFVNGTDTLVPCVSTDPDYNQNQLFDSLVDQIFAPENLIHLYNYQKCFSLFSRDPEDNKNYTLMQLFDTIYYLSFNHYNLMNDFSVEHISRKFRFAVLDSREMPNERQKLLIDTESIYLLELKLSVIVGMEAPYETGCKNYEKNSKVAKRKAESADGIEKPSFHELKIEMCGEMSSRIQR